MPLADIMRRLNVVVLAAIALAPVALVASDRFPFDQELIMDARPMRPAKRVPSMTISAGGAAQFDLWCRSVNGRVELGDDSVKITADALPQTPPQWMAPGQCTEERMRADEDILSALTQVTGWRRRGQAVELTGPETLRFWPSSH